MSDSVQPVRELVEVIAPAEREVVEVFVAAPREVVEVIFRVGE